MPRTTFAAGFRKGARFWGRCARRGGQSSAERGHSSPEPTAGGEAGPAPAERRAGRTAPGGEPGPGRGEPGPLGRGPREETRGAPGEVARTLHVFGSRGRSLKRRTEEEARTSPAGEPPRCLRGSFLRLSLQVRRGALVAGTALYQVRRVPSRGVISSSPSLFPCSFSGAVGAALTPWPGSRADSLPPWRPPPPPFLFLPPPVHAPPRAFSVFSPGLG